MNWAAIADLGYREYVKFWNDRKVYPRSWNELPALEKEAWTEATKEICIVLGKVVTA